MGAGQRGREGALRLDPTRAGVGGVVAAAGGVDPPGGSVCAPGGTGTQLRTMVAPPPDPPACAARVVPLAAQVDGGAGRGGAGPMAHGSHWDAVAWWH